MKLMGLASFDGMDGDDILWRREGERIAASQRPARPVLQDRLAALSVLLLVAGTARAQLEEPAPGAGWYISGSGMAVFPQDAGIDGTSLAIDFSTGLGARVGGGYTFMPPEAPLNLSLSLELEYVFRVADIDKIEGPGVSADLGGDATAHSFMINFIGEIQFGDSGFGLYGGGGFGVGIADVEIIVPGLGTASDNDIAFAWQFLGGVKYHIDTHWMVYTGVRYWSLDDLNFSGIGTDLSTVDWEFGFRYYF